ncbi:MAG: sigma-70 family RNA polymerase sigma factor [Planctomycetes bacterium]|nr:sigma-70 family RNA polymerase sigma factor [Planctomycetota bacterium]
METDRTLLEHVRQRRPGAFEKIYHETRDGVYGLLLSCTGRVDTAEELLQETYSRFLRRVYRTAAPMALASVRGYLLRIARNLVADTARRPARESGDEALMELAADPAEVPEIDEGEGEAARALRLLRRLPEDQREVIVLRLYNDLTYPEISALTHLPVKTLESRYRYGIQKLRALWSTRA